MSAESREQIPASMTNKQVEDAAVDVVIAYETAAGRTARDTRYVPGSPADVTSKDDVSGEERLIEIKAYGRSARGTDLWLEEPQVAAGLSDPSFHLYVIDNVRSGDPLRMQLLDLSGEQLRDRLGKAKKRSYYTVPFPVSLYDLLAGQAATRSIIWRIMDAVAVLHQRGYHRIRFFPTMSPSGMHLRLFIGRDTEVGATVSEMGDLEQIALGSFGGELREEWDFAGTTLTSGTRPEKIAERILTVIPPLEPIGDDPDYVNWFAGLLQHCRAANTTPLASQSLDHFAGGSPMTSNENGWLVGDQPYPEPPARRS